MARWLTIVNRAAGRTPTTVDKVASVLATVGADAEIVVLDSKKEAEAAIADAARTGTRYFALAGGDGTLNFAANVLLGLDLPDPPVIALLPVGTGCDILRTFGIPLDLGAAASHLVTDDVYPIDVATLEGAWGTRFFVNVAQVGVGAAAAETARHISRRVGPMRYPAAFLFRLTRFPVAHVRVETDRRTYESSALAVIMANGQFFAGGWNVAPKATLVDGVLDMQVIDIAKRRAPAFVPKVIRGTHLTDKAVRRFSAATFSIETDVEWPVEADGDFVGNTPVSGRVLAGRLRLKI